VPSREVAGWHLLFTCLLIAFAFVCSRRRVVEGISGLLSARPGVFVGAVGLCGILGDAALLFIPTRQPFDLRVALIVGVMLVAAFTAFAVVTYGIGLSKLGWRLGSGMVMASFLLAQVIQAPYYLFDVQQAPLYLIAPAGVAVGTASLSRLVAWDKGRGKPPEDAAQGVDDASAARRRPLRGIPWRVVLPALFIIYFCSIFIRLLISDFTGDAPSVTKFVTYAAGACVMGVVSACLLLRQRDSEESLLVALSLLAAASMAAMALMLVFGASSVVPRRILVACEHAMEAFVWMVLVYAASCKGADAARSFGWYLVAVGAFPWLLSFDLYYLGGLDAVLADSDLLIPGVSTALVVLALTVIWFLLSSLLDLRSRMASMSRRQDDAWHLRVCEVTKGAGLTEREQQIVELACRGHSARRIGEELSLSEQTVKTYSSRAYRKLGVHSKQELMAKVERVAADDSRL
jgi:DNA-binding CsgD family transcriptional regulator